MTRQRHLATLFLVALLPVLAAASCQGSSSVETVNVSMKSSELYSYATVGGDEDGARIATQAKHFNVSEIRRGAETGYVATFVYQPAAGFVGTDYAEIEILTGSDGASPPSNVRKVAFRFTIHD